MNRSTIAFVLSTLLVAPPVFSAGTATKARLTVDMDGPVEYRNTRGERVQARYGKLSDDSLYFVKVTLPDGKEYTLPRAMSASGARYTDERELVWWEHQGKVRIEVRAADGDWTTRYEGLVPVAKSR